MSDTARRPMSLQEFLAWDDGTERRYELIEGEVRAMAPPSEAHGTITANLAALIRPGLRRPCRVIIEAGVIPERRRNSYYQADLIVTCDPPDGEHRARPLLLVEVLSASTKAHDRGIKLPDYTSLEGLREILLVDSQERHVQVWRRGDGRWEVENVIGEGAIALATLDRSLKLAEIYADVPL